GRPAGGEKGSTTPRTAERGRVPSQKAASTEPEGGENGSAGGENGSEGGEGADRHPGAEPGCGVAGALQQQADPTAVAAERLEQLQHPYVGRAQGTGAGVGTRGPVPGAHLP